MFLTRFLKAKSKYYPLRAISSCFSEESKFLMFKSVVVSEDDYKGHSHSYTVEHSLKSCDENSPSSLGKIVYLLNRWRFRLLTQK